MKEKTFSAIAVSAIIGFFLSRIFGKRNTFYGGRLLFSTVKHAREKVDFAGIYFQQGVQDGSKHDDNFELLAYAAYRYEKGLNYELLPVTPLYNRPFRKTKTLRFSNNILTPRILNELYEDEGSTSDLSVYPLRYADTNYVAYSAETTNSPTVARVINPSPPARSY